MGELYVWIELDMSCWRNCATKLCFGIGWLHCSIWPSDGCAMEVDLPSQCYEMTTQKHYSKNSIVSYTCCLTDITASSSPHWGIVIRGKFCCLYIYHRNPAYGQSNGVKFQCLVQFHLRNRIYQKGIWASVLPVLLWNFQLMCLHVLLNWLTRPPVYGKCFSLFRPFVHRYKS